jgi:DNA-binding NtrC family response regulator
MEPRAGVPGLSRAPPSSPLHDAAGVTHILLVEDSAGDAGLVTEYLADPPPARPVTLVWVTRLDAALAALRAECFDVVLLDLVLPDAGGVEAVEAVAAVASAVPIVVTTGLADERLAARALRAGACDVVTKDLGDADRLRRAVRRAVERRTVERRTATRTHLDRPG